MISGTTAQSPNKACPANAMFHRYSLAAVATLAFVLAAAAPLASRAEPAASAETPSPVADPVVEAEIVRRTRLDFTVEPDQLLDQLRESIPDVTDDDVTRWTQSGDLVARKFDGQTFYFHNAAANLFRTSEEARQRRPNAPPSAKRFDLNGLLHQLIEEAETSPTPEIAPVR